MSERNNRSKTNKNYIVRNYAVFVCVRRSDFFGCEESRCKMSQNSANEPNQTTFASALLPFDASVICISRTE